MLILNNQERRRRNKVRSKPNIRPRTQILPEPSSPLTDPNIGGGGGGGGAGGGEGGRGGERGFSDEGDVALHASWQNQCWFVSQVTFTT